MGKERYKLAEGARVREERFGLLFYTMAGPRLFFLPCGRSLDPLFFEGECPLDHWLGQHQERIPLSETKRQSLGRALRKLVEKGVLIAC